MRRLGAVLALLLGAALLPAAHAASSPFDGCQAAGTAVSVGVVACMRMPSADLGGTTAFSYYVPPACAPALGRRCPTVYLLHGFGGDLTSMLGRPGAPSAWVAALTSKPRVPPEQSSTPWTESDPSGWVAAPALDVVLVAPDGRTVPGGFGPQPWLEGFWADWNPRYAAGGDTPRYGTPAPRFASFVTGELVPFVEAHFPVGSGREQRAIAGTSLGGYGSYAIGLMHPDLWSSIGAVSGIMNILLLPGLDPVPAVTSPVGVQPPAPVPVVHLPGPAGASVPLDDVPTQARNFAVATYAFGDPAADQAYYRARMPRDLALNASAWAGSSPVLVVRGFSNDAVPRRTEDFTDPPSYLSAQAFESIVLASNLELNHAFDAEGVRYAYQLHPGIHSDPYWNPWLREQLEAQYAALRHWDGSGSPPPKPTSFSFRSAAAAFSVWGWQVAVDRPTTEFLELDGVSCQGLTLRGTGRVTLTVPGHCHAGVAGSRVVHVDLGPAQPTDAPAGADALSVYGRTVHVTLAPLGHG